MDSFLNASDSKIWWWKYSYLGLPICASFCTNLFNAAGVQDFIYFYEMFVFRQSLPVLLFQKSVDCTITQQHTIIFSNRAKISFSEVIFEDSSSKWCEVDDEEVDQSLVLCFDCVKGGRSFLLPGMRMLANLSSYRERETPEKTNKKEIFTRAFKFKTN